MTDRNEDTIEKVLTALSALLMVVGAILLLHSIWVYPTMINPETAPAIHIRNLSESLQTRGPGIILMVLAMFPLLVAVIRHSRD